MSVLMLCANILGLSSSNTVTSSLIFWPKDKVKLSEKLQA